MQLFDNTFSSEVFHFIFYQQNQYSVLWFGARFFPPLSFFFLDQSYSRLVTLGHFPVHIISK